MFVFLFFIPIQFQTTKPFFYYFRERLSFKTASNKSEKFRSISEVIYEGINNFSSTSVSKLNLFKPYILDLNNFRF